MNTGKPTGTKSYYIIKSTAGLTVMVVEPEHNSQFLTVYEEHIIARGKSLYDVLTSKAWKSEAANGGEEVTPGKIS